MGDSGGLLVQLLFGDDGIEFCKGMSSGLTLVIFCSCRSQGPPLNSFTTRERAPEEEYVTRNKSFRSCLQINLQKLAETRVRGHGTLCHLLMHQ
jgi:hypothetical protein